MNTVTSVTSVASDDEIDVTGEEIAAFVSGQENEPAQETDARARRVLAAALSDSVVRERLLWLRSVRADWETEARSAEAEEATAAPIEAEAQRAEATRLSALQERLSAATLQSAGLDQIPEKTAASGLWNVWKTGGGRWATGATESMRGLVEAVGQAGQGARALTLGGQRTTLSLPCLAPAHAAPAIEIASPMHQDAITTADGVRITFQQSPGSGNRMRVLVDASHLTPASGMDGESRPAYNVAFLTLMEGDETESGPPSHSRHLLVVTLNERGKGYSDFSITAGDLLTGEVDAQKCFPAPHAGGCRLVAATLSQMPPSLDV